MRAWRVVGAVLLVIAGMAGCSANGGSEAQATGAPPTALFTLAEGASHGFSQASGLAVSHDGHKLFFTARRAVDDAPAVYALDLATQAVTQLYGGDPLVEPGALVASADGSALMIADVAADSGGELAGTLFRLSTNGASPPQRILPPDTIDLPGGIATDRGFRKLYVTGFTPDGTPAVFACAPDGTSPAVVAKGDALVDPGAIAVSSDQTALFVVDSGGGIPQAGALLRISLAKGEVVSLASGLPATFDGGVTSDAFGTDIVLSGRAPATHKPAVIALRADTREMRTLIAGAAALEPAAIVQSPVAASVLYLADGAGNILSIFH